MIPLERSLSFRLPLLSGADVRLAQQALRRAGMGSLATDGIFGPATRDAVRRFQQAQGLLADGILGPASWRRLMQAAPPSTTRADWRAMLQPFIARLTEAHGAPIGNAPRLWQLTADGLLIDGQRPASGMPMVARAWATHGTAMQRTAQAQRVPVELLLACACTESGGRADAVDVLKRDFNALVGRDIDASDTGHEILQIRVIQTQQTLRLTNQERGALRGKAPLYR
jgi:hypothetical protein